MTIAAIGMQYGLQRLTSISQNLANVSTPAYKREISFGSSFEGYWGDMAVSAAQSHAAGMTSQYSSLIDASAGSLRHTGNPWDLAIEGEGFFEVMTPNGTAYTRQGAFHKNIRGQIVGEHGFALIGNGAEITISDEAVTISPNGDIYQGNSLVGQIKLVRFANPQALAPIGNGLFHQGGARLSEQDGTATIRAGYQENSNVNSAQEMVRLVETVRHFESMQRIFQGYDEALEKAIRKLGEF